eukprot:TRINITY_DN17857_c0_g1_i1.p1 TRINITY_DN17857_c0_g1~~TRINITY_DN17857_c0_g1_i1.p1  ORF type:complete len:184 (+),score=16.15 TRINITY_DN17857_c0_g1_i1:145-696(+)
MVAATTTREDHFFQGVMCLMALIVNEVQTVTEGGHHLGTTKIETEAATMVGMIGVTVTAAMTEIVDATTAIAGIAMTTVGVIDAGTTAAIGALAMTVVIVAIVAVEAGASRLVQEESQAATGVAIGTAQSATAATSQEGATVSGAANPSRDDRREASPRSLVALGRKTLFAKRCRIRCRCQAH